MIQFHAVKIDLPGTDNRLIFIGLICLGTSQEIITQSRCIN